LTGNYALKKYTVRSHLKVTSKLLLLKLELKRTNSFSSPSSGNATPSDNSTTTPTFPDESLSLQENLIEEIKNDHASGYYKIIPLRNMNVKTQFVSNLVPNSGILHANFSVADVDYIRRKKMCDFVMMDLDSENDTGDSEGMELDDDVEDKAADMTDGAYLKTFDPLGNYRKRSRKIKSNDNFTKINLKCKRFTRIQDLVKTSKGSALKRQLFRLRNKKSKFS